MSERYTRFYNLEKNLYAEGAPVVIKAGALLGDKETGNFLGQVKFKNISSKKIIFLKVELSAYDMADRPLGGLIEFQYTDLSAEPYASFGSDQPIVLPDAATKSFRVHIKEVIFDDKSIWAEEMEFEPMPNQKTLEDFLHDSDLAEQYRIKTGSASSHVPAEYKDLYLCACGNEYKKVNDRCPFCGKAYQELARALEPAVLEREKEIRGAKEKKTMEQKRKRRNRIITVSALSVGIIAALAAALNFYIIPEKKYKNAGELAENGAYEEAAALYAELGNYKDAEELFPNTRYIYAEKLCSEGAYEKAGMLYEELGTYKDSEGRMRETLYQFALECEAEGRMAKAAIVYGRLGDYEDAKKKTADLWEKVLRKNTIAAGTDCTAALNSRGYVLTLGRNVYYSMERDTYYWPMMNSVEAGDGFIAGIDFEGGGVTDNILLNDTIKAWGGITYLFAEGENVYAVKKDGKVKMTDDNFLREYKIDEWEDIVALSAVSSGQSEIVAGLKSDGTVIAASSDYDAEYIVNEWTDITDIAVCEKCIIGLKEDGTVVAAGSKAAERYPVEEWKDIVLISAGKDHVIGLKADGTVAAAGSNEDGKCDVEGWSDIVSIAAGDNHTVGLKADGTMTAVGSNEYGQCDVFDMEKIHLPRE